MPDDKQIEPNVPLGDLPEALDADVVGLTGAPPAESEANSAPRSEVETAGPSFAPQAAPMFSSVATPPEPTRWRPIELLAFLIFSGVWLVLSLILSLAGYAALRPLMGWRTPLTDLGENTFFDLAAQAVFYGPLLVFIVLLVVVQYRQPFWEGIHWRWPGGRRAIAFLCGGVLLAVGVAAASMLLPDRKDFPLEKLFSSPSAAYALGVFAVLVAPFIEELIFRGVLFAFLQNLAGVGWAVAGTALLFAALHYQEYEGAWTHLGMILAVGLVFSLARATTRSVAPAFLLHTAYNATFIGTLYVGTHHFRQLHAVLLAR